jgi:Mg2+ and Co2+ transporter CorA
LHTALTAQKACGIERELEAMSERSTVQRIGDLEQMVTSFRRHLRAENKADQTITAYT